MYVSASATALTEITVIYGNNNITFMQSSNFEGTTKRTGQMNGISIICNLDLHVGGDEASADFQLCVLETERFELINWNR